MIYLKDKQTWLLGGLAFLSLIGLIFIQSYWLKGMWEVQEQRWFAMIYDILKDIDDEYEDDIEEEYDMDGIVADAQHLDRVPFLEKLDRIIAREVSVKQWVEIYEYGLVSLDHLQFQYFSDVAQKEVIFEKGISKKLGTGKHHYELYLYVPNKKSILYQGITWMIAFSVLFVLALVSVFAYTLNNMARQKQLSTMKNDFINSLTHEFKTPIATIALATKTLKNLKNVQADKRANNYIDLIKEESTRLENHVDKVLQMSLVDSGNFTLNISAVNIHEKILEVVQSLQLIMQESSGKFDLALVAQNAEIQGDAILLFNLLYNIIDNAIKYCEEAPIIEILTENTTEGLSVIIKDNGIGMSQAEQQSIFERFYRTGKNKVFQSNGFGLGLNYVKQVADAHQAKIDLESELGKGTCFKLVFPQIS